MKSEQLIKDLIKQDESGQLEFKEVVRKEAIGKTICGFLNNEGGQLLIGIADNREIKGVKNADKLQIEIEQFLLKELVPEAPVMVSVEKYGDKQLLLIKVWEGSKQPYIFNGSIYYRRKDRTIQASSKEISELIHKRQETEIHWERQSALGVELDDLDLEEIQKTMELALSDNKMKDIRKEPIDCLTYYGLFQNGNFTNAAVVLFAKKPSRFIPQARVRIAFLDHGKTGDIFKDDQLIEGNLFKNIESIQYFFEKHLSYSRKFDDKNWKRTDDYIFPMAALREGVMNALVHREYGFVSSTLSIIIYPDKLEITNSGKSPFKQSELKKNHLSMPFNPDIAHIVFLRGYIEKIGRGTLKIIDACKQAGLKAPIWDIGEHTVKLTFYSDVILGGAVEVANKGAVKGAIEGTVEGAIEGTIEGSIEGAVEEAVEGATRGVKEKLAILLSAIAANEGNRVPDYKKATGLTDKSMERYIKQLKEVGLIEFRGDALHTGGYYLTKKIKVKLK
ncbi:MAG: putative DNA binding domain-containing protein [Bacteroidota bacterium]|nr:putative DNA binding domain-containing protein [Bacteroidota bacterium]